MALVGLDIGATHVRACRLKRHGKGARVVATAEIPRHDENGVRRPLAVVLTRIDRRLGLGSGASVASSDMKLLIRYLATIPMPPDRLERLLRLEMQQQAGSEGDLAADAQVLPVPGDEITHCCVYAQPDEVDALLEELATTGIQTERIHVGPVALGNALATAQGLEPDQYGLVLDIGAKHTTVALQRGDCLQACRQLDLGGDDFSEALAKEWGVRFERAEQAKLKGDVLSAHEDGEAPTPSGDGITRQSTDQIFQDFQQKIREHGWKRPEQRDQQERAPDDDASGSDPTVDADTDGPGTAEYHPGTASVESGSDDNELLSSGHDREPSRRLQFANEPADAAGTDTDRVDAAPGAEQQTSDPSLTDPDAGSVDDLLRSLDEEDRAAAAEADVDSNAETIAEDGEDGEDLWQRNEGAPLPETAEMPAVGLQTAHYSSVTMGPELTARAEKLCSQTQSTLNWFKAQLKLRDIQLTRIAICGGGSELVGLDTYLARRLRVRCLRLDPFHALEGATPELGHRFATALGLAMSELPDKLACDVRPESRLRRRLFWTRIIWPRVAAVIVLAAVVVFAIEFYRNQSNLEKIATDYQDNRRQYAKYERQLNQEFQQRKALKKDYYAIAGRLFGGRDMLMTIRSLKEHAPKELWIQTFRTTPLSRSEQVDPDAVEVDRTRRLNTSGRGRGAAAGRNGGGDSRGRASSAPEVYDTMLDRGSLFLSGFIKPEDEAVAHHEILVRWLRRVQDWHPPGSDIPMFHGHGPIKTEWEPAEARFRFEIRLDFHPARLTQVTEGY